MLRLRGTANSARVDSEVLQAIAQNERRGQDIRSEWDRTSKLWMEFDEELQAENTLRLALDKVLTEHREERKEEVANLERELTLCIGEVDRLREELVAWRKESISPIQVQWQNLDNERQGHENLVEMVKAACRLEASVEHSAEMAVHGLLPDRPKEIFTFEWELLNDDEVMENVPPHHASKYRHNITRAKAYDNIAKDCKAGAEEVLRQLGSGDQRERRAQSDLKTIRTLEEQMKSKRAEFAERKLELGFEEFKEESLDIHGDAAELKQALQQRDKLRDRTGKHMADLEDAESEVHKLASELKNSIAMEDELRTTSKNVFQELCDKQTQAVHAQFNLATSLQEVEDMKEGYRKLRIARQQQREEDDNLSLKFKQEREIMEAKHKLSMDRIEQFARLSSEEMGVIMKTRSKALSNFRAGTKLQLPPVVLDVTQEVLDCRRQ